MLKTTLAAGVLAAGDWREDTQFATLFRRCPLKLVKYLTATAKGRNRWLSANRN